MNKLFPLEHFSKLNETVFFVGWLKLGFGIDLKYFSKSLLTHLFWSSKYVVYNVPCKFVWNRPSSFLSSANIQRDRQTFCLCLFLAQNAPQVDNNLNRTLTKISNLIFLRSLEIPGHCDNVKKKLRQLAVLVITFVFWHMIGGN